MKGKGTCKGCGRRRLINLLGLCKRCNKDPTQFLSKKDIEMAQAEAAAAAAAAAEQKAEDAAAAEAKEAVEGEEGAESGEAPAEDAGEEKPAEDAPSK
ncbi:MAG: hypothetical protein KAR56_04065 [Thermoplasmata archaeon]|nr:hypothetical protein [Thermoplasmata archaeon]